MTSPDKDLLQADEGVNEGSSTSTEEMTGVQNPIRRVLGDPPPSEPAGESDPAAPDDVQTDASRRATGPGQQLEAGEG